MWKLSAEAFSRITSYGTGGAAVVVLPTLDATAHDAQQVGLIVGCLVVIIRFAIDGHKAIKYVKKEFNNKKED